MKTRLFATLAMLAVAGCSTTQPAQYAATLSSQDPKWQSPECVQIRAAAMTYEAEEKKTLSIPAGLLLGPYGLGIAVAGKDHQAKVRKRFSRDMHLKCSSQPLPADLQIKPTSQG